FSPGSDTLKTDAAIKKHLDESLDKLFRFVKSDLKFDIDEWEGVVRSITRLEHSAIEVELYFPLLTKVSGNSKPNNAIILSDVNTSLSSNLDLIDKLNELAPDDKVSFSGTIETFGSDQPAIRSYNEKNEDVLKTPVIFIELKDIKRVP